MTILSKGWQSDDTFTFWVPATAVKITKSESTDKDGKKKVNRWIQGIASTSTRDLQGEIVEQGGIDFSYFLKHGYFNNDHKPGAGNKVGEPTECKITKNGLWVKGFLYNDNKLADDFWELMHAQEMTPGSKRRVGFSIEGKVKRRNGTKIEECWIQDIAITPAPVNTATWAEVAKSLSHQWIAKAIEEDEIIDEGDKETSDKSLSVGYTSPLVPESLDGKVKQDVKKSLTFQETVQHITTETGLSMEHAETIASLIFASYQE